MKIDTSLSTYSEHPCAPTEFDPRELSHARYLMRRLQFLEQKVRDGEYVSGGMVHAEREITALEWALGSDGLGYLAETDRREQ